MTPTLLAADGQPLAVGDRVGISDEPPHNYRGTVRGFHTEGLVWVEPDGRDGDLELEWPNDLWHEDAETAQWLAAARQWRRAP